MKWIIFVILASLFGCDRANTSKSNNEIVKNCKSHFKNRNELKMAVLYSGDTAAYELLYLEYFDTAFSEEFLIYAIIMANKYDYT